MFLFTVMIKNETQADDLRRTLDELGIEFGAADAAEGLTVPAAAVDDADRDRPPLYSFSWSDAWRRLQDYCEEQEAEDGFAPAELTPSQRERARQLLDEYVNNGDVTDVILQLVDEAYERLLPRGGDSARRRQSDANGPAE